MKLEFRRDFEDVWKNWGLFWEGKLGRPIIRAIVPKRGFEAVKPPAWGAAFTHSPDEVVEQALRWAESVEFLCGSVPYFTPSLMTGFFPALLGTEIKETREPWGTDTAVSFH
jgi:hypothetical protein